MVALSYFIIGFVFIFISRVSAGDEDAMKSCLELFDPEGVDLMCCESLESFKNMSENYDECLKENSECEDFQCILNQRGMMKDDQIDEAGAMKFYEQLEQDYPDEKPLIERVRRECMGGKYATYPPEDGCPAVKFYVCSYIHTFLECDTWKKHDVCSKMADNVKKCKTALGE